MREHFSRWIHVLGRQTWLINKSGGSLWNHKVVVSIHAMGLYLGLA